MSEMDEITRDTSRTFRDVLTVAGQWLRTLRNTDGHTGKLTRKQRRELGQHIQKQVKAERIAAAWYTKRVGDYQAAYTAVRHRREADPFYSSSDAAHDLEYLNAMRFRIEDALREAPLLAEHRGQVVQALDNAQRAHISQAAPKFANVFPPLDTQGAREARHAAVESEQWVHGTRTEMERHLASMIVTGPPHRQHQQHTASLAGQSAIGKPAGGSASGAAREAALNQEWAQVNAVQAIRHAQNNHASGPTPWTDAERRRAAAQASAAGMSTEQVRWEFANTEANSRCRVSLVSYSPDGSNQAMRAYFPSEADAAAWTRDAVHHNEWQPGTQFTVRARETGHRQPFYVAQGNQVEIGQSVEDWNRQVAREQAQPPDQGRDSEKPSSGADSEDLERRVLTLQRGLDAVTTDRDNHKRDAESVRAELDTVKNRQLRTDAELKDLRSQLENAHAERDRFRGERDEAVRKLVADTPEQERLGSQERIAREQQAESPNGTPHQRPQRSR